MPAIETSIGSIHYTEQGQGQPLVLLHANPGEGRDFEAVIPQLARNHRVIALDWPGYGGSSLRGDPSSASVFTCYAALVEFVSTLGLPPAVFIGNSVGGNAAVRLAIEQPQRVRGLVLASPGGFTPHNALTRGFCRLQGSRLSIPPYWFARLYLRRRTPATEAMLQRARGPQSTSERMTLNRAMWRSFGRPESDLRVLARAVAAPTLLLFGAQDPAIPAAKDGRVAARAMPSAKLVVLPCGHAPFAEAPGLFLAEVESFLAGLPAVHGPVTGLHRQAS